ncbi:hypothetical protein [Sphingomonas hankyongi]|uniref:5-bromo-4-chloroindolyl phosphate hydrolase n=1 Tax=Sphingomonas hankyongi TaxID=2908209 RepID=A0ABT0RY13_9SPHN|nr:hypothetical protein [Sphingomonas hankyongi]MCL6728504.1 hypothetical protein [Sphingomonas hankyongi]
MTEMTEKVERAVARFDRITRQIDEREGPARDAARRERQRLNADLVTRVKRVGVAVVVVSIATILFGLIMPIGMFGFLAAVCLAIGIASVLAVTPARPVSAAPPAADLPNGAMVQRFDSYLYKSRRALPAPAQAEIDAISSGLASLQQTLERVPTLDPQAQDARRLMSNHLPDLIDRYMRVPPAFRTEEDGEGKTVDERLVEGLSAGRKALNDISQNLARADVAALETQGRFIQSRYNDQTIDG